MAAIAETVKIVIAVKVAEAMRPWFKDWSQRLAFDRVSRKIM